jgi:hypothetical protein
MPGLPKRMSKKFQVGHNNCVICSKVKLTNILREVTLLTNNLKPGELLHVDFYFMNQKSMRDFTCVLLIINAKTRKMWQFCTPNKKPPLDTITFFSII